MTRWVRIIGEEIRVAIVAPIPPTTVIAELDPAIHCAEAPTVGGYVYSLASERNGTLYIGVTSDLIQRVYEHREKVVEGFTKQHKIARLIYFEQYDAIYDALQREKNLKKWSRAWKIALIEEKNLEWHDLYPGIAGT